MVPDSPESRIGRLEREHAQLDERVGGLSRQMRELIPLTTSLVRLEGTVGSVKEDIHELRDGIADRDKQQADERRSLRLALLGLSGTILAALIAAVVTIVASGAHP